MLAWYGTGVNCNRENPMAQAGIQVSGEMNHVRLTNEENADEQRAPNGKLAVLVNGKWVGFVYDESGGSRGNASREMVYFTVDQSNGGLRVVRGEKVTGKWKRVISKQKYAQGGVNYFEARTVCGDRCHLFTL